MMMDLPMPAGASSAMLTHVAARGDRLVALGDAVTANGTVPFAALSRDGGASWREVPITTPRGATVTALTATASAFVAAGRSGNSAIYWTSSDGSVWSTPKPAGSGITDITGLAPSATGVTGVGLMGTRPAVWSAPVR
jgi:hypothetical protein